MAEGRRASSPDVGVTPYGTADGSGGPGPADPGGSGTIPEGQVAKNERQHLLWQLFRHCEAGGGAPPPLPLIRPGEKGASLGSEKELRSVKMLVVCELLHFVEPSAKRKYRDTCLQH